MFSQKLVLSPELEMNIFGKDDEVTRLRLQYELTCEFAPYVGINWGKKYGNTATFASSEDEDIEDLQVVTGVRF
jgi:copper resistance protein B